VHGVVVIRKLGDLAYELEWNTNGKREPDDAEGETAGSLHLSIQLNEIEKLAPVNQNHCGKVGV
jgi:hypothetical protein